MAHRSVLEYFWFPLVIYEFVFYYICMWCVFFFPDYFLKIVLRIRSVECCHDLTSYIEAYINIFSSAFINTAVMNILTNFTFFV